MSISGGLQETGPTWIDQLREAALWPQHKWAPAETVDILLATREMRGWLNDSRPYDGQHKPSWSSALADYLQSTGRLGPRLRRVLGAQLKTADSAATSLKTVFDTAPNKNIPGVVQGRRRVDARRFARLSTHWGLAETRLAAWSDLIEACRNQVERFETLALRRDLFWQIVQAGGQDADQLSRLLAGVLGDSAYEVAATKYRLGDIGDSAMPRPVPQNPAGLEEAEQLDLCERLLTQPPAQGDYVVWIAFDHAGPPDAVRKEVGPISFWDCDWVREKLRQGGPGLADIPSELQSTTGFFGWEVLPDGRDVRLVRVALGSGAWTDPVRVAVEQAEAVVTMASFNIGDAKWRPMTGYLVARDDHVWSIGTFHPQREEPIRPNDTYQSAMDAQLDALVAKLRAHLPIVNPELFEVIKAMRWWEQARHQAPLAAVMLHVRVLELLSQRVGTPPWQQYANEYQRDWWVRETIIQQLAGVVDDAVHSVWQVGNQADQVYLEQLGRKIRTNIPGRHATSLKPAVKALPDLVHIFTPYDNIGRRAQDLVAQLTVATLPARCVILEAEWKLILDRLQRLRNALAHGGPIEDESAETVQAFVARLAHWALTDALQGLIEGKTVAQANRQRRRKIERWKRALPMAPNVPRALAGPR